MAGSASTGLLPAGTATRLETTIQRLQVRKYATGRATRVSSQSGTFLSRHVYHGDSVILFDSTTTSSSKSLDSSTPHCFVPGAPCPHRWPFATVSLTETPAQRRPRTRQPRQQHGLADFAVLGFGPSEELHRMTPAIQTPPCRRQIWGEFPSRGRRRRPPPGLKEHTTQRTQTTGRADRAAPIFPPPRLGSMLAALSGDLQSRASPEGREQPGIGPQSPWLSPLFLARNS